MPFDTGQLAEPDDLRAQILRLAQDAEVQKRLGAFARWKAARAPDGGLRLTDCHDDEYKPDAAQGHYLTTLVMQGGGMLGMAHVGFVTGLELAGFRFPAVAGTSAGAIATVGLFAYRRGDVLRPVGDELRELVAQAPMDSFVDGPRPIRRIVKRFAAKRSLSHPVYLPGFLYALRHILRFRGLNSGHVFEHWMRGVLKDAGLETAADLHRQMARLAAELSDASCTDKIENPLCKDGDQCIAPEAVLKLIATAMPTGMKFCLPRDLDLLHDEYQDISAARMVRMSMSIPLFFEPCVLRTNQRNWRKRVLDTYSHFVTDRTALDMADLDDIYFLDGGLFSNLPSDEAVDGLSSTVSSISVPLVNDPVQTQIKRKKSIKGLISDVAAVADAVRLQRDRDAHFRMMGSAGTNRSATNKTTINRRQIVKIDTRDANWLNFTMKRDEQDALYAAGLARARDFVLGVTDL